MFIVFGCGFVGTCVSGAVAAAVYGHYPSPFSIVIICIFFAIMLSTLLWLIPYLRAFTRENNRILAEYGTAASKTSSYLLQVKQLVSTVNGFLTVAKMLFTSEAIYFNKNIKLME